MHDTNVKPREELYQMPKQFKWNQDSKEKFLAALHSSEVQCMISEFENTNFKGKGIGLRQRNLYN